MEEVFVVPLHASDWGVDDFDSDTLVLEDTGADAVYCLFASFGIADDASLAYVAATCFELRLDEDNGFALPCVVRRAEGA